MANYAPLGNAIFGETLFGVPPSVSVYTALSIVPFGYDTLEVNWTPVSGTAGQMLLRSAFGTPTSIYDGEVLLSEAGLPGCSAQYVDSGLPSGQFYYYALFVLDIEQAIPQITEWVLAGSAQGLVLTQWGFGDTYVSWMPDWYLELDAGISTAAYPNGPGPLTRYLSLIGYETDWIRSEIETLVTFANVDYVSGALLPYLGANYGMGYEPELGMTRSRVLVKNAVYLYKNRGTAIGIEAAASAFSGFGAKVVIGKNLEIQLDDSAFDRSAGHWIPANATTSVAIASASSLGVTAAHGAYNPANNDNVAVIGTAPGLNWVESFPAANPPGGVLGGTNNLMVYDTASNQLLLVSSYTIPPEQYTSNTWSWNGTTWTELSPATNFGGSFGAAMAYDTATSTAIIFGGETPRPYEYVYNWTWSWNGTTWTELFPATSPPARYDHAMAYDAAVGEIILFGGVGSGPPSVLGDTWAWNGTTWTELFPATSPPARSGHVMAYDTVTGEIVLFGGEGSSGALGDTWTWNGTTWTQQITSPSPAAQSNAVMTYDASTNTVFLFATDSTGLLAETWTWSGAGWVLLSLVNNPAPRSNAVMAYDYALNAVVLFGGVTTVGYNSLSDTWSSSFTGASPEVAATTCTTVTASTLGIPVAQPPAAPIYVVSASLQPEQRTTPTLRAMLMQIDWYGLNGVLISSSVGASIVEVADGWIRPYVEASPPAGALTFGRTVRAVTAAQGDLHLMDAEQVEINTQATPGPTTWHPPRDIRICLFPIRQNLIPNPAALAGTYGWTLTGGTLAALTSPPVGVTWPAGVSGGFSITAVGGNAVLSGTIPVNQPTAIETKTVVVNGSLVTETITDVFNYTLSAYLQAATTGRQVQMVVQYLTASNAVIETITTSFNDAAAAFTRGSNIGSAAPALAVTAKIEITIVAAANGEIHYVAAPLFAPESALLPYFDGNFSPTTDYLFEGTPNESASDYYPSLQLKLSRLTEAMVDYIPIGATFTLVTGASAFAAVGEAG